MEDKDKKRMEELISEIQQKMKSENAEAYFICAKKGGDNFFTARGEIENLLADTLMELHALDKEKGAAVLLGLFRAVGELFNFEGARRGAIQ